MRFFNKVSRIASVFSLLMLGVSSVQAKASGEYMQFELGYAMPSGIPNTFGSGYIQNASGNTVVVVDNGTSTVPVGIRVAAGYDFKLNSFWSLGPEFAFAYYGGKFQTFKIL